MRTAPAVVHRTLAILAVALMTALVAVVLLWKPVPEGTGGPVVGEFPERPRGGEFVLQSREGPVSLSAQAGKVVLIYFGYTWCPDICPTNLAFISKGLEALSPGELGRVRVLFVSVDPERDTLERLRQYTAYFHPSILGVTGSSEEVKEVADRYGAAYRMGERDSAGGYTVDHSADTYVVGPDGALRETLGHGTPPSQVAEAIRRWLPSDASS